MLIVVTFFLLFLFGLFLIECKKEISGSILSSVSVALMLTGIIAIGLNQLTADINYNKSMYNRSVLVYQMNKQDNFANDSVLVREIIDYNNELSEVKYWAKNPFTNWFCNQKIAEIDHIPIPEFG